MKGKDKMIEYMRAYRTGGINGTWSLLSKERKRYARYLVERYGYRVTLAIQRAYLFGFDRWPLDYRIGKCVREKRTADSFGLR